LEIVKILIENGADVNEVRHRYGEIVKKAMNMQWTPKIHYLYSKQTRSEIVTMMKLKLKNCQIGRIPKDILLIIFGFATLSK
jgi:hypothetical protein